MSFHRRRRIRALYTGNTPRAREEAVAVPEQPTRQAPRLVALFGVE